MRQENVSAALTADPRAIEAFGGQRTGEPFLQGYAGCAIRPRRSRIRATGQEDRRGDHQGKHDYDDDAADQQTPSIPLFVLRHEILQR